MDILTPALGTESRHRIPRLKQSHVVLISLLTLFASHTYAGSITFATFTTPAQDAPVTFENAADSAVMNATTPIDFAYSAASGLSTVNHSAILTLVVSTSTPATATGTLLDQPISDFSTVSITEVGTGKDLLTMIFTGDITGEALGSSASLAGAVTAGDAVFFASDFLTFSSPGNAFSLSLTGMSPTSAIGAGGFLSSFSSNISGSFQTDITPVTSTAPEPLSRNLFFASCTLAALVFRRRSSRG